MDILNILPTNNYESSYISEIMIIVGVFATDAMKLAEVYTLHSNRNSITVNDIRKALKTRAFYGDTFWNRSDIQVKINEMRTFLQRIDEESEESEESDIEIDGEESEGESMMNIEGNEESQESEENGMDVETSQCTCGVCLSLNDIEEKWNTWQPSTHMEVSIKNAINQTFY